MEDRRKSIYDLLEAVTFGEGFPAVEVMFERPEQIKVFPSISYRISDNHNEYDLDRQVGKQDTEVVIDFWAKSPKQCDTMLLAVELAMNAAGYLLSFSSDIPDRDGVSHITTIFNF